MVLISASYESPSLDITRSPVRLNMNFGGVRGEKLDLLNLVVAAVDGQNGVLTGFTFYYDDGMSASYGSTDSASSDGLVRPSDEAPFAVRGRDGERITEIRVFRGMAYQREHIVGFQVLF